MISRADSRIASRRVRARVDGVEVVPTAWLGDITVETDMSVQRALLPARWGCQVFFGVFSASADLATEPLRMPQSRPLSLAVRGRKTHEIRMLCIADSGDPRI